MSKKVENKINSTEDVEVKKISGIEFADIKGLGSRDVFFIEKKYTGQLKSVEEWNACLSKEGII